MDAPPMLQEMIAGETKENMEERIREDLWNEEWRNISYIFPHIVPDIMDDLVRVIVTSGATRSNYLDLFPHIHPNIIRCAVSTAEEAIRRMEDRYIHAYFNNDSNDDYSESEDENAYSEGMYF